MKAVVAIALALVAVSAPATVEAAQGPSVTGYGATISAWNSAHKMITKHGSAKFPKDTCYGWASHSSENDNRAGCRYLIEAQTGGHVSDLIIWLPDHTSLASAEKAAIKQLPNDRQVLWKEVDPGCAWVLVHSSIVGAIPGLGSPSSAGLITIKIATTTLATKLKASNAPVVSMFLSLVDEGAPYTPASVKAYVSSPYSCSAAN